MKERLLLEIGDNTVIREESLSEELRSLRPDLNFVTRTFGSSHIVLIDISCPYRRISYGTNTLEKVYLDKKKKYNRLVQETSNIVKIHVEIILIIVSSLGAIHARSLEALRNFFFCNDKKIKRIARPLSQTLIVRSIEIWRRYPRDMPPTEEA
jgi:hypothetical protein